MGAVEDACPAAARRPRSAPARAWTPRPRARRRRAASVRSRTARAASTASAKLRRWKAPRASDLQPGAGVGGRDDAAWRRARARSARPAPARRDAGRCRRSASRAPDDVELLGGDVGDRRAEPARVLQADVGEHRHRRAAARWWRRSARRARPRPPRRRPRARAKQSQRGRGQQLELRDVVVARRACGRPSRPRPRRAGSRRRTRRPRRRRRRCARARRRRPGAVTGRRRPAARGGAGSPRSCGPSRTCRWCPTTWIEANRSCGEPSAVSRRRIRSSPKRMPNSSRESSSRSASSKRIGAIDYSAASSALSRSSFSRSAATTASGALATKPWLAACPRRARSRLSSDLREASHLGGGLGRVDAFEQLDLTAADRDDRHGRAIVVGDQVSGARAERRARRRSSSRPPIRAARNAPGLTPPASRHERTACTVAMTRSTSRLGVGVARRDHVAARRARRAGPRRRRAATAPR